MRGVFFMVKKTIIKTVNNYKNLIKRAGIPVNSIIVFGSQIKGTAKKWSDIDVCVVSPIFGKNRYDERIKLLNLSSKIDINIEPHPYSPSGLMNRWDSLAAEIKKYGVVV